MTYTFKVLKDCDWGKTGDIIEVVMKMSEFDAFKAASAGELERYYDHVPAMAGIFGARQAVLPKCRLPPCFA